MANSVKLFFDDLATTGHDDKVLAMTISEFGRCPEENGSGLEGNGFIGNHPNLASLDSNGNLQYDVNFRRVYTSVMQEWLCINSAVVNSALLGESYDRFPLGISCSTLSTNGFSSSENFSHSGVYKDGKVYIRIESKVTQHIVIKLYNILGQEVSTLKNETLSSGTHNVDVKASTNTHLYAGQYIYRISVGNLHYSKSIIVD